MGKIDSWTPRLAIIRGVMRHSTSRFVRVGYGRLWTIALAVGVASLVGLAAVGAQAPSQEAASDNPQVDPQRPTFQAGVTLVTTDVIVRDKNGAFIPNLDADDFTVSEDGVLQEIASLVLVHGGRVYNELSTAPPVQEGIILPSARRVNDTAGRIIILFVDDLHLTTSLTPKVRDVFRRITKTLIHEGDLYAILSTGPSSLRVDLTYDHSYLLEAEEKIIGDGPSPNEIIQMSVGARGPTELGFRAHVAMKTARSMIEALEEVRDRRKVFVYLSSGYDLNPFEVSRLYDFSGMENEAYGGDAWYGNVRRGYPNVPYFPDPFLGERTPDMQFADADMVQWITELTRAANRANTSFYTVDPRGLVGMADLDQNITGQASEWNDYVWSTQGTLRMLAELTGGKAIINRNDFEDAMREVDAETSDYYVLGYYTNNPDPTVHTRRLQVDVDREDVDVRHRETYTFSREALGIHQ